jgi:hypothetical protein
MLITLECSATRCPCALQWTLDGGFEMLRVSHSASPDGEMFASDQFMRTDNGKVIR